MTRDDMQTIVQYYLRDASAKGVLEDEDIQANAREVYEFLTHAANIVESNVRFGAFDG